MAVLTGKTADQVAEEKTEGDRAREIASLQATLNSTDWYVTRKAETGRDVPEEVLASREAARVKISQLRGDSTA